MESPLLEKLINALRLLPSVGPKTAQRMALHILERDKDGGLHLAQTLNEAISRIGHCKRCRTLSESDLCSICSDIRRDDRLLCVVENPIDILALEQTHNYRGRYFVLHGRISPLDGIGPNEIGINEFNQLISQSPNLQEVVIATNPTIEGEATAHYLSNLIKKHNIKCSRIAYGVPIGGELEYLDSNTLIRAFTGRIEQ